MPQPVFINSFQKGSAENANIGPGVFLGVETYSKKGVARLSKKSTKVSGSVVTDLPIYFAGLTEDDFFAQGDRGRVYKTTDSGDTWTEITNPARSPSAGDGKGLVFFDGILYAFYDGEIDYCESPYGAGDWTTDWETATLSGQNFPFIFPSAYGFYFANGNKLGLVQQKVVGTAIDPSNTATYNFSEDIFQLPDIYTITCLSFLPPNLLVMGTKSSGRGNDTQIADIITWDTISKNKFSPPLRLYSNADDNDTGVTQLINRNNTCYAVVGGNHSIFQTNGSTFTEVTELALRTNYVDTTGEQATSQVFLKQYPSAISILGNKLLTGVSTSLNNSPGGTYALYPMGVWSVAFMEDDTAIQCEFPISTGTIRSNNYAIGALRVIPRGQVLIGWKDGSTYGIDKTEYNIYNEDPNTVALTSPMMEIATPLKPYPAFQAIEINLVRDLVAGQLIAVYARTGFDKPWTFLEQFDTTSWTDKLNALKVTKNPLGNSQFLQILVQASTGGSNQNKPYTPEIRTIIVS